MIAGLSSGDNRWLCIIKNQNAEKFSDWGKKNPKVESLPLNPWIVATFFAPEGPLGEEQEKKAKAFLTLLNKYESMLDRDIVELEQCLETQIDSAVLKRRAAL
jgi:hypothetical protein